MCGCFRDLHKVEIEERRDEILVETAGLVGDGGNSGFHALNLAIQFGVARVLLIGFDAHLGNGLHWYGANSGKDMRNPIDGNFVRWRKAFNGQAGLLRRLGVDVVNASQESAITVFPKMTVEAALARWGI